VRQACWDEGYAIARPAETGPLADYIRVTTGTVDVIDRFARVLDRVLDAMDSRPRAMPGIPSLEVDR